MMMIDELKDALNEARTTEGSEYGPAWSYVYQLIGAIDCSTRRQSYEATERATLEALSRRRRGSAWLESDEQIAKEMEQGL